MKREVEALVVSVLCVLGILAIPGTGLRSGLAYAAFMFILLTINFKTLFRK